MHRRVKRKYVNNLHRKVGWWLAYNCSISCVFCSSGKPCGMMCHWCMIYALSHAYASMHYVFGWCSLLGHVQSLVFHLACLLNVHGVACCVQFDHRPSKMFEHHDTSVPIIETSSELARIEPQLSKSALLAEAEQTNRWKAFFAWNACWALQQDNGEVFVEAGPSARRCFWIQCPSNMPEQHAWAISQRTTTLLIWSAVLVVIERIEFLHHVVPNPAEMQ